MHVNCPSLMLEYVVWQGFIDSCHRFGRSRLEQIEIYSRSHRQVTGSVGVQLVPCTASRTLRNKLGFEAAALGVKGHDFQRLLCTLIDCICCF